MYRGRIYGHATIKDGVGVSTDYIKDMVDRGDHYIAKSFSGRWYLLWKDKHHLTKRDVDL